MAVYEFSKADIATGKYVYTNNGVYKTEIPITFDKRMSGVPKVTLRSVLSNKTAVAQDVTPEGFTIVISDGDNDGAFEIHYHAICAY